MQVMGTRSFDRYQEKQSMAKSYGVAGVVASFLARSGFLRGSRLSSDEAELLAQYRALTESDQVAMRYLIGAMKSVSRF
jgi:hypothetical protein